MPFKANLPAETVRNLDDGNRRWRIEFATRALAVFLSFIAIVIFAVTVHQSTTNYGGSDWTDGMPIAPLLIALLYNLFLVPFTIYHRQGRAIHPAWSVAADLLVWALGVPAIVLSIGVGWFWWWQPVRFVLEDGTILCAAWNWWSEPCNPLIYKLGKMEIAANVFLGLVMMLHFVLFVRACIATHRRRQSNKREQARRRNIELQYHRSPEEHQRDFPAAAAQKEVGSGPVSPVSPESEHETAGKYA